MITYLLNRLSPPAKVPSARVALLNGGLPPAEERSFFWSLAMPDGTWKATEDRRLDDFNETIASALQGRTRLCICDVGASSGITTFEWLEDLRANGFDVSMTATDRHLTAFILTVRGLGSVLLDAEAAPLQFEIGGNTFGVHRRRDRLRFPLRAILLRGLAAICMRRGAQGLSRRNLNLRRVALISPRASRSPIRFVERSISDVVDERFDVIRAANVLNLGYFPDAELRVMLRNITFQLTDDGLLAVCRTDSDGTNHGSVFRRAGGRFVEVAALGRGSDIKDLVLAESARSVASQP